MGSSQKGWRQSSTQINGMKFHWNCQICSQQCSWLSSVFKKSFICWTIFFSFCCFSPIIHKAGQKVILALVNTMRSSVRKQYSVSPWLKLISRCVAALELCWLCLSEEKSIKKVLVKFLSKVTSWELDELKHYPNQMPICRRLYINRKWQKYGTYIFACVVVTSYIEDSENLSLLEKNPS